MGSYPTRPSFRQEEFKSVWILPGRARSNAEPDLLCPHLYRPEGRGSDGGFE